MKAIKSILVSAIGYILDTIAPPDMAVRRVENMSMDEFIESAGKESEVKPVDGILHLFPYRSPSETVKTALVTIKTYHNPRLVKLVALATYHKLREKISVETSSDESHEPLILIPIAMTRKSIRARGWNQCEIICREIALLDALNARPIFEYRPDILIKVRETADQVGQDRSGRFENLKNSCTVRKDKADIVRGKDIIILDDIVTTGSTLSETRRAMMDAGARNVLCVAVAH